MNSFVNKLKFIYFGVALLDLLAIFLSLLINHRLGSQYVELVHRDSFWAAQYEAAEKLQNLASEVNAPGNDLFESKNAVKEKSRLWSALENYWSHYYVIVSGLRQQANHFSVEDVIALYKESEDKVDDMVASEERIFRYFESNQKAQAGIQMAKMDQQYALLRHALVAGVRELRKIQFEYHQEQKKFAAKLRRLELAFAVFVAAMIIGMIFYGTAMSRFIDQALKDMTLAKEQAKALDAAAIVAITDKSGRITYANNKFLKVSGYGREEIYGKNHRILNSGHHSKEFFENLWATIVRGDVWKGEMQNRKKDGSVYWVDSTIVPMKDVSGKVYQFIAIRNEITDRKRIEEKLNIALHNSGMAIWSLDLISNKVWRSEHHDIIFGYTERCAEWTHELFLSHIHPEDRERVVKEVSESMSRPGNQMRCRIIQAEYRGVRWVEIISKTLFEEKGKPIKLIGTIRDITSQVVLEENLLKSKNEAETATKTKATFLANMSHEIRTPMNGIIGMSKLLLDSASDQDMKKKLEIIHNCGNSLLDLINDILDFSRLESGKVELEKEPFALHDTVRKVLELFRPRAKDKEIELSYVHDASVPEWVIGDVTRFRQIITNLLDNAVKFIKTGSIHVSSSAVKLHQERLKIQFTIKDTGIGIPAEVKTKLFLPFSQVDASTTRKFGGSGLGLSICRGLCEAMGGRIDVESQMGKGSTFTFSFQAQEYCQIRTLESLAIKEAFDPKMSQNHPLRILLVEDNHTNQLVARGFLGKFGYQAVVASNGKEAIESIKSNHYDLILMDCNMPEMDGFEATRQILDMYAGFPRPKIIALTAGAMKEDVDRCMKSGMDGFISKPITHSAFQKVLLSCKPVTQFKKTA